MVGEGASVVGSSLRGASMEDWQDTKEEDMSIEQRLWSEGTRMSRNILLMMIYGRRPSKKTSHTPVGVSKSDEGWLLINSLKVSKFRLHLYIYIKIESERLQYEEKQTN